MFVYKQLLGVNPNKPWWSSSRFCCRCLAACRCPGLPPPALPGADAAADPRAAVTAAAGNWRAAVSGGGCTRWRGVGGGTMDTMCR